MAKAKKPIDKVRASRDGHEFHEAWTARLAMRLLLPQDNLFGIAVEGLEPGDQARALAQTVEVADITLYYGKSATFRDANRIEIVQFKYSIAKKDREFRASDAKKTIRKFGVAYRSHKKKYGAQQVREKLSFELVTNRPIYPAFIEAIEGLAEGKTLRGAAKTQAEQFKSASCLNGRPLAEFASKCLITGFVGNLSDTKKSLSKILVDWSATSDALAKARLGGMRQMVRDKAGSAGTGENVIRITDILAALDISDVEDLLPCPPALVPVGKVVEREQLGEVINLLSNLSKPLLIHATGGIGKTVFLESLAEALISNHEVLFFDCFGGGAYRSPEDSRHLPRRGLIHIVNILACRGLCDPVLPGSQDVESLLRMFRRRLKQSVSKLKLVSFNSELVLILDAIDNAAIQARDRGEDAFPILLLESLHKNPLPGLKLIVSSRSHRIPIPQDICHGFELSAFTERETDSYIRARLPTVREVEIKVAQSRSNGNARILEHLLQGDRGLLDASEIDKKIELNDLIQQRIDQALSTAVERGYKSADTDAFLAGLAVLPPPVPLMEYAEAQGVDISAVESFASDLSPLLERTKHGLMFRDEPTETLIHDKYASLDDSLNFVAKNLLARQDQSVYAARALPALFYKLGNGDQLFNLAFDDRFPRTITSTVGRRNIRYARLSAAVRYAADKENYDQLVHLLLEMSTVTSVDQRGAEYIMNGPDLVIAAQDADAIRRLFETRTEWQGTRHARLAIANALSGDVDEASRHAITAEEWLNHFYDQKRENRFEQVGPERFDVAAIPFVLICQQDYEEAADFMKCWKEWYAYEVNTYIIKFAKQVELSPVSIAIDLEVYLEYFKEHIGGLAAALSFADMDDTRRRALIQQLASACRKNYKLDFREQLDSERSDNLTTALYRASGIALSLGLRRKALAILKPAIKERPGLWSFQGRFAYYHYAFSFLLEVALTAASTQQQIREKDLMPKELFAVSRGFKNDLKGNEFYKELKKQLEKRALLPKTDPKKLSHEEKREAEEFINSLFPLLLTLTTALVDLLNAAINKSDKPFIDLINTCSEVQKASADYRMREFRFTIEELTYQIIVFALWIRSDLGVNSVKLSIEYIHQQSNISAYSLIELVTILAKRPPLHTLAGKEAIETRSFIEQEKDVQTRAYMYANLARAIMPASTEEAAVYFRAGLEQTDSIGSGDYEFTNELLLFASSVKGDELDEKDFHTLMNICELNITDEPQKFPWLSFGSGLSRTAGCRVLTRLSRWDDRSKVSLSCTLLPCLKFLVENRKIDPEDAVALNRLADPIEFHVCNTGAWAITIKQGNFSNEKELIEQVVRQYEENNHGVLMSGSLGDLAAISAKVLGRTSSTTRYLKSTHVRFEEVRDKLNEHMNYRGRSDHGRLEKSAEPSRSSKAQVTRIVNRTNPVDAKSLSKAIDDLDKIETLYSLEDRFFEKLRAKVLFSQRPEYIRTLSEFENLNLYRKLDKLKECRESWGTSSAALSDAYQELAFPILRLHVEDLVDMGQLSGYLLREISELSSVPISLLALELVRFLSEVDVFVSGSVWLGLASFICEEAGEGEGQKALSRLLNSDTAKLSSSVLDGAWKPSLYPRNDSIEICSGMVWRMLGSPHAADRWHAAHSLRCFARFERWSVIDAVVDRIKTTDARPFGAPELPFYFLHAKLWLLIALARIARDRPKAIAKYKDELLSIVYDKKLSHVLVRYFATVSLLACVDAGALKLPANTEKDLRSINESPFPRLKKKLKTGDDFYQGRPTTAPRPKFKFHLDYYFHKHDVQSLSEVFGKPGWELEDTISEIVNSFDPTIASMYDAGGRKTSRQNQIRGMISSFHTHGQQLGWHALFITAGKLLADNPVTDDSYYEDPWNDWLKSYLLTREDGLWLSDGMDRSPHYANTVLLEKGKDNLEITGEKSKILDLVGLRNGVKREVVVTGRWHSADEIRVSIRSVLVKPRKARAVVKQLTEEEPMHVWLPTYDEHEEGDDYNHHGRDNCSTWIVWPSGEGRLDEDDPTVSIDVNRKPRIAQKFASTWDLKRGDPFGRVWKNKHGKVMVRSLAWGYESKYTEEGLGSGVSLVCSKALLSDLLSKNDSDLLLLINLQRYEKGYEFRSSKYTHTVAVVRLKKSLEIEYHKGRVNHLYQPEY